MRVHRFDTSVRDGALGAAVLDRLFAPDYIVVPATEQHDRGQGVDRFLIKRTDGRVIKVVDYKNDLVAGTSGNLALEEVSVETLDGRIIKRGWTHTSIATHFVFYVPRNDVAYLINAEILRKRWPDIAARYPLGACQSWRAGERWVSRFYLANIVWLREQGLFEREMEALGIQIRFRFPNGREER